MVRKKRKQKKSLSSKNRSKKRILISNKSSLNIDNALNTALYHHQNGQLNKAEKFYKKILREDPNASRVHDVLLSRPVN
jgi:Tfp pilus assembly protein PilF